MSKAIHSEIVELILTVDKFENKISETKAFMDSLRVGIEKPMVLGFKIDTTVAQTASRIRMEIEGIKQAQEALNKLNADTLRAQLGTRLPMQGVGYDGKRTGETYLNSDAKMERLRLAAIQSVVEENRKLYSVMRGNLAVQELEAIAAERQAAATAKTLAATKSSAAYGVGSHVADARGSALLSGAGMAAFSMGASGIGSALFMAERLSYSLKLGQVSIGEYAQKLGLLKVSGEGAAASMATFGAGLLAVGAAATAVAAGVGLILAGNKLSVSMANMSTLLADATIKGNEFNTMMDDAEASAAKISVAYGTDMVEIVDGFKMALSAGINANELEEFGNAAMRLAKGLDTSFSQATNILTTFKDAYSGAVADMEGYSDIIFNAINVGKFDVGQLNSNIGRIAVTAAEAGVSVKDMMASLAALTRVGMSTSQAITSLNQMLVSITNPSDKAAGHFDQLGIAYGGAALKGRNLIDVVAEIKAKVGDMPDLYGKLFSEERGRRGIIGLTSNLALLASTRAEIDKIGTATVAADRAMNTLGQNLYKIWLGVTNAITRAGSALGGLVNAALFGADMHKGLTDTTKAAIETAKAAMDAEAALKNVASAIPTDNGTSSMLAGITEALKGATAKATSLYDKLLAIVKLDKDTANEKLVRAQVEKDMPLGGGPVTPEQLAYAAAAGKVNSAQSKVDAAKVAPNNKPIAYVKAEIAALEDELANAQAMLELAKAAMDKANAERSAEVLKQRELKIKQALGVDTTLPAATTDFGKHEVSIGLEQIAMSGAAIGTREFSKMSADEVAMMVDALATYKAQLEDFYAFVKVSDQISYEDKKALLASIEILQEDSAAKELKLNDNITAKNKADATSAEAERKKRDKDVEEQNKAELASAKALYNLKLDHYKEEEKRINTLSKKHEDALKSLAKLSAYSSVKGSDESPERARRRIQEDVEGAVGKAKKAGSYEEFSAIRDAFDKAAREFIDIAKDSGFGAHRADVIIQEQIDAMKKLEDAFKDKTLKEQAANNTMPNAASAAFKKEPAENPYFKESAPVAERIIKDTLALAAKTGLSVNGDLAATIDISKIEMNLDVKKLGGVIKEEVERQLEKLRLDTSNNIKRPGDDRLPPGAKPNSGVGSGYSYNFDTGAASY